VTLKGQYRGKATSGQLSQHRLGKDADWLASSLQPDYPGHFAIGAVIGFSLIGRSWQDALPQSFALCPLLFALCLVVL
jgi:hypothetical protein